MLVVAHRAGAAVSGGSSRGVTQRRGREPPYLATQGVWHRDTDQASFLVVDVQLSTTQAVRQLPQREEQFSDVG